MNKMIIKNFIKPYKHVQNSTECIGPHNKKIDLKSNSESLSYYYCKKNTNEMPTRKKEKVTDKKSWKWQNILIFRFLFKIQEEVKFLPTNWINRNENSKMNMMKWSNSL